MDKFRSFIEEDIYDDQLQEMAVGKGDHSLKLPITDGMANLLSLFPNNAFKAKMLDWLLFDGLKKAIVGRQKLCDIVNRALRGELNAGTVKGPVRHTAVPSSKAVVGEARQAAGAIGRDMPDINSEDYMVHPCDLFSPKAYQRDPRLGELNIDGLSISEYYEKYFEPREMIIDYIPGEASKLNLQKTKEVLIHKGLEPFTYGGFHGYLQHVEKGDRLPSHEKQFDPNDQWGVDLSIDTSEFEDGEGATDYKGKRIPTLHLVGGSVNKNGARNEQIIIRNAKRFEGIAKRIEQGQGVNDLNPKIVNHVSKVLDLEKEVQKVELGMDEKGVGKIGMAGHLGIENSPNANSKIWKVPKEYNKEDLQLAFNLFKKGLSQPFEEKSLDLTINDKKVPRFTDLDQFGANWDGQGPEPDGWYRQTNNNKVIVKLSRRDQEAIYKYMVVDPMQQSRSVNVRPDWGEIPEFRNRAHPKAGRFFLSTLINAGKKSDPEIARDFKRVLYNYTDVDTSHFLEKMPSEKIKIQTPDYSRQISMGEQPGPPVDPVMDPTLVKLWDSGYRWELRDPVEKKTGSPNWIKYDDAILKLGSSQYKVTQDVDPNGRPTGNYYLIVPKNGHGEPLNINDHGLHGRSILAAGGSVAGGAGGHIKSQPAGPKTYQKLMQMLMSGEMGEKAVQYPIDLDCVKQGVSGAKFKYASKKGSSKLVDINFENNELFNWAIEALRLYSGTSEWQVGFLSKDEIRKKLKWSYEKQIKAATQNGWGIDALMKNMGVGNRSKKFTIDQIVDEKLNEPIYDLSFMTPAQQIAIKKNSFEARKWLIQGYVLKMMTKTTDNAKARGERSMKNAGQLVGRDGGNGGDILDAGKKIVHNSDWESGNVKPVSPDALLPNNDNDEDLPSDNPIATFNQGRLPTTRKPLYTQDNQDDDWSNALYNKRKPLQTVNNPKLAKAAADSWDNDLYTGSSPMAAMAVPKQPLINKAVPPVVANSKDWDSDLYQ